MIQTSFHLDISVVGTTKTAHQHIANVQQWWATDFQGSAHAFGDVFTVRFGTTWVTFRVSALTDRTVTWTVQDCFLPWLKNREEWTGTTVEWLFVPTGDRCEIQFTHVGLTPEVECFSGCAQGWTRYVTTSLPRLFEGLPGAPK